MLKAVVFWSLLFSFLSYSLDVQTSTSPPPLSGSTQSVNENKCETTKKPKKPRTRKFLKTFLKIAIGSGISLSIMGLRQSLSNKFIKSTTPPNRTKSLNSNTEIASSSPVIPVAAAVPIIHEISEPTKNLPKSQARVPEKAPHASQTASIPKSGFLERVATKIASVAVDLAFVCIDSIFEEPSIEMSAAAFAMPQPLPMNSFADLTLPSHFSPELKEAFAKLQNRQLISVFRIARAPEIVLEIHKLDKNNGLYKIFKSQQPLKREELERVAKFIEIRKARLLSQLSPEETEEDLRKKVEKLVQLKKRIFTEEGFDAEEAQKAFTTLLNAFEDEATGTYDPEKYRLRHDFVLYEKLLAMRRLEQEINQQLN